MARYLGVAIEDSFGVAKSPNRYFDIASESIKSDQSVIFPETVGQRNVPDARPGPFKVSGSIDMFVEPRDIGILLEACFGTVKTTGTDVAGGGGGALDANAPKGSTVISLTTVANYAVGDYVQIGTGDNAEVREITAVDATANDLTITPALQNDHLSGETCNEVSAPYTHTFKIANEIPSVTLEVGADDAARQLKGTAIVAMSFEAPARELLSVSIDVLPQHEKRKAVGTPSFSDKPFFVFHEGEVKIAGAVNSYIEAFRFKIENSIPDDAFVIGSRYLPTIHLQGIEITGDMDIAFMNWNEYNRFLSGSTTGSEPGSLLGEVELVCKFTIDSSNWLEFKIANAVYMTSDANIDRRERKVQAVSWRATGSNPITVTLVNELPNWR